MGMIENPKLSLFPVLGIIWFGMSLTNLSFSILKLRSATKLARNIPTRDVLERVLSQRKVVQEVMSTMKKGSRASDKKRETESEVDTKKDTKKDTASLTNQKSSVESSKSRTKVVPSAANDSKAQERDSDELTFSQRKAMMEEELKSYDDDDQ